MSESFSSLLSCTIELVESPPNYQSSMKIEVEDLSSTNLLETKSDTYILNNGTPITMTTEFKSTIERFKEGHNIFLSGPGGCGKTTLLQILIELSSNANEAFEVWNPTGMACMGNGGKTYHSALKFMNASGEEVSVNEIVVKFKRDPERYTTIQQLKRVFIDELSMVSRAHWERMDQILRKVRDYDALFGGLQLIVMGDLLQLPPVITEQYKSSSNGKVYKSSVWKNMNFVYCELTKSFRQSDQVFIDLLNRFRVGSFTRADIKLLRTRKITEKELEKEEIRPTFLTGRKDDALWRNTSELDKLGKVEERTYVGVITYEPDYRKSAKQKEWLIDGLKKKSLDFIENCGVPLTNLIKVAAQVMLRHNLDPPGGLCNGSRGVVVGLKPEGVDVKFLNGRTVFILVHKFKITLKGMGTICYKCVPLSLGWAITIHKSQGLTLDSAVISFNKRNIFESGQHYVALSRIRALSSLYVLDLDVEVFRCDKEVVAFYKQLKGVPEGEEKDEKDESPPHYSSESDKEEEEKKKESDSEVEDKKTDKKRKPQTSSSESEPTDHKRKKKVSSESEPEEKKTDKRKIKLVSSESEADIPIPRKRKRSSSEEEEKDSSQRVRPSFIQHKKLARLKKESSASEQSEPDSAIQTDHWKTKLEKENQSLRAELYDFKTLMTDLMNDVNARLSGIEEK